ncbi:unnamed protein product [Caretta caretta]
MKKPATLEIYHISDQCRAQIKQLKTEYWKTRNQKPTLDNLLTLYPFYDVFDQVLGTALSAASTTVHDDLIRRDGDLVPLESSIGTVGNQQQSPAETSEATLL